MAEQEKKQALSQKRLINSECGLCLDRSRGFRTEPNSARVVDKN